MRTATAASDVIDGNAMQVDHLSEHAPCVLGGLKDAGHVGGLEVSDEGRLVDELVVVALHGALAAPHPTWELEVQSMNLVELGEQVPGVAGRATR
jgi:hypothetical protein